MISRLTVATLDDAATQAWDEFVDACPEATFFHRAGWRKAIQAGLRRPCHFLYAERNGEIRGVLPLVHIKSRLFGNSLVSTGFTVGGGPVALDDAARSALDDEAAGIAEMLGVDYIEYRAEAPPRPGWTAKPGLYVLFRKAISADHEANLASIPRKQRAMVRKGIASGMTSVIDADVDRLHRIYAESVRNLGTPVIALDYLRHLKEVFAEACDIVTVLDGATPVASVMNFYFRDQVLPYYGGGTHQARALAANDFMYWEVTRRAAERGFRLFDFGRSKEGTGAYAFKKNWGFKPTPAAYQFKLRNGDALPDINPLNPKYRLFIAAWKRLPLPIAKVIGPHIARSLG